MRKIIDELGYDLIVLLIAVFLFVLVLIYNHSQDNRIEKLENLNKAFTNDIVRIINEQKYILIEQRELREMLEELK